MNRAKMIFPSQRLKASHNIRCLQSSSKKPTFHHLPCRQFHATSRYEEKVNPTHNPPNSNTTTDPLLNSRLLDNVLVIEKDLSSLLKQEAKNRQDSFLQTTNHLKSQFLDSNFSFTEKGTKGHLQISTKDRKVEIEWDLTVVPKMEESDLSTEILNAPEDQTVEGDDQDAGEVAVSQEGDIESDLTPKASSADVNFEVNIFHQSNAVRIRCTAGVDSRLYILSISKSPSDPDESIEVNDLSEELQQRLYDYLEELSITDLVACFIRQYNLCYRENKQAESLKSLLQYFSK